MCSSDLGADGGSDQGVRPGPGPVEESGRFRRVPAGQEEEPDGPLLVLREPGHQREQVGDLVPVVGRVAGGLSPAGEDGREGGGRRRTSWTTRRAIPTSQGAIRSATRRAPSVR